MSDNQLRQEDLTATLVYELIKEKRSERRWRNFRFIIWFLFIAFILFVIFSHSRKPVISNLGESGYVSLIRLNGMISPEGSFSAVEVLPILKDAFSDTDAKGVILEINSGGGTPVQASIIHDAILEMKKKYHKKVIVVGEDMLASGAYYVAVAGDKIYVNPNTVTGSIGVIMKGFGFPDLLKKIGVERRVYTSGENKDRLDPFLPQNKDDVEKIQQIVGEIHDNFNQVVLEGRKGKLHADPKKLFSGDFWSGRSALNLGLVDGLGNLNDVMQTEFHVSRFKDYSESPSILKSLTGQFGMTMDSVVSDMQVKLLEKV